MCHVLMVHLRPQSFKLLLPEDNSIDAVKSSRFMIITFYRMIKSSDLHINKIGYICQPILQSHV